MTEYVYVENSTVVEGPRNLPKAWKNISGFDTLSDPELKELGWYPVVNKGRDLKPSDTQVKEGPVITFNENDVTYTWSLRDKTKEELNADAAEEDANKDSEVNDAVLRVMGKAVYLLVNQVRELQLKQPITPAQFKAWLRNQI